MYVLYQEWHISSMEWSSQISALLIVLNIPNPPHFYHLNYFGSINPATGNITYVSNLSFFYYSSSYSSIDSSDDRIPLFVSIYLPYPSIHQNPQQLNWGMQPSIFSGSTIDDRNWLYYQTIFTLDPPYLNAICTIDVRSGSVVQTSTVCITYLLTPSVIPYRERGILSAI